MFLLHTTVSSDSVIHEQPITSSNASFTVDKGTRPIPGYPVCSVRANAVQKYLPPTTMNSFMYTTSITSFPRITCNNDGLSCVDVVPCYRCLHTARYNDTEHIDETVNKIPSQDVGYAVDVLYRTNSSDATPHDHPVILQDEYIVTQADRSATLEPDRPPVPSRFRQHTSRDVTNTTPSNYTQSVPSAIDQRLRNFLSSAEIQHQTDSLHSVADNTHPRQRKRNTSINYYPPLRTSDVSVQSNRPLPYKLPKARPTSSNIAEDNSTLEWRAVIHVSLFNPCSLLNLDNQNRDRPRISGAHTRRIFGQSSGGRKRRRHGKDIQHLSNTSS
ncbi:hypothetical protein C8Q76DRAFT_693596 [Earliella scabrosa]|nr:hypothetical protein C8Q76DRAFT_693596 [Earliella scabrosa]